MPITVKPQDKTRPEKLELELPPGLIKRLHDYAKSLDDSDLKYVASQIFEQVLPAEKAAKKAKTEPAQNLQKEKISKVA